MLLQSFFTLTALVVAVAANGRIVVPDSREVRHDAQLYPFEGGVVIDMYLARRWLQGKLWSKGFRPPQS